MSRGCFFWRGEPVAFGDGESIAVALSSTGLRDLGTGGAAGRLRYFCGIGACQSCLVAIDGSVVEACLTPAREGLDVTSAGGGDD